MRADDRAVAPRPTAVAGPSRSATAQDRGADSRIHPDRSAAFNGLAALRDSVARSLDPVHFDSADPTGFRAGMWHADLGTVQVGCLMTAGRARFQVHRPSRLIRQSDPEAYRFLFSVDGFTGVSQAGRYGVLGPGDIGLHDTSQPLRGWRRTHGDGARLLMVTIPRATVPIHADKVRQLTGMKLPGDSPVATVVTSTVSKVVAEVHRFGPSDRIRMSTVVVELITTLLSHALDMADSAEPHARHALLARVQAFIEQRLDDPALSPRMVAVAHHVAPRTLDRLFAEQQVSVAAWIRHRRLERCRLALADPMLAGQPIYAVATRYGFADGAHLSRAFKAAYGVSPQEYRQQHLPWPTPA